MKKTIYIAKDPFNGKILETEIEGIRDDGAILARRGGSVRVYERGECYDTLEDAKQRAILMLEKQIERYENEIQMWRDIINNPDKFELEK